MVVIIFKKSEKNQFTLQCSGQTLISELLSRIIEINNIRIYLDRLIWSVEELANKGVLKPAELQGVSWEDYQKNQKQFNHLSEEMKMYAKKPIVEPPHRFVQDKHNQRYGVLLSIEDSQKMLDAVKNGKKVLQPKQEIAKIEELVQAIQQLREAVMQAYPAYLDLPQWQPTVLLLQEKLDLEILQTEHFELYDKNATVWWAGKEMDKDKLIREYSGKNQKTKLIVKVQKLGGEQPLRQPPIDAETYQKMVKFYYKKVEQTKQFEKKSVESHYDKVESKSMKARLHLDQQQIRFKPF